MERKRELTATVRSTSSHIVFDLQTLILVLLLGGGGESSECGHLFVVSFKTAYDKKNLQRIIIPARIENIVFKAVQIQILDNSGDMSHGSK